MVKETLTGCNFCGKVAHFKKIHSYCEKCLAEHDEKIRVSAQEGMHEHFDIYKYGAVNKLVEEEVKKARASATLKERDAKTADIIGFTKQREAQDWRCRDCQKKAAYKVDWDANFYRICIDCFEKRIEKARASEREKGVIHCLDHTDEVCYKCDVCLKEAYAKGRHDEREQYTQKMYLEDAYKNATSVCEQKCASKCADAFRRGQAELIAEQKTEMTKRVKGKSKEYVRAIDELWGCDEVNDMKVFQVNGKLIVYSLCKKHNYNHSEMECPICYAERFVCKHCRYSTKAMNPSGFCCHLYYPDNCEICNKKKED